jgi:hypothetical protein
MAVLDGVAAEDSLFQTERGELWAAQVSAEWVVDVLAKLALLFWRWSEHCDPFPALGTRRNVTGNEESDNSIHSNISPE